MEIKERQANIIVLTGFSGAGKSAVGQQVARSLGWRFMWYHR